MASKRVPMINLDAPQLIDRDHAAEFNRKHAGYRRLSSESLCHLVLLDRNPLLVRNFSPWMAFLLYISKSIFWALQKVHDKEFS